MISGSALTRLIEFPSGVPDGDVSWSVRDVQGTLITSGAQTPLPDAVSMLLVLPSAVTAITAPDVLQEMRELTWSFEVDGVPSTGQFRFTLEKSVPVPASIDGVRQLLGVPEHNLADDEVSLVEAYWDFLESAELTEITSTGSTLRKVGRAVEALAALRLFPTLHSRLAQKETSGTDSFTRFDINSDELRAHLNQIVLDGLAAVAPAETEAQLTLFAAARGPDRFFGE